ncbi:MAG TPA: hypothetical protein VGC17_06840 [Lactovum miscens]|uniref:hypothetical protein n=1 Tax=Lactovum miscens TaxID=190387 RepID=UPI002EDB7A83
MSRQNCCILQSGEVVRDTGLLYFYNVLTEMDQEKELKLTLGRNHIGFELDDTKKFEDRLFNQIVNCELYRGSVQDLRSKKIADDILEELKLAPREKLAEILTNNQIPEKMIQGILKDSQEIYFPYLRNNGKFGGNAQSVSNVHQNLKELIHLFVENLSGKNEERKAYGEGAPCDVCLVETAPIYDITHKYNIEIVDKIPKKDQKIREDSKDTYTFRGSKHTTYNNYGNYHTHSAICFDCEFFNLFFLLYVKLNKPKYLVSCSNLKNMYLLQRRIRLKQDVYTMQSFYYQVAKETKADQIRMYSISIDSKKGPVMNCEEIIDYKELLCQIKLMDLVDVFLFPEARKGIEDLKKMIKRYILNRNYEMACQYLLSNIVANDGGTIALNYAVLIRFIKVMEGSKMEKREYAIGKSFWNFGYQLRGLDGKSTVAFRLTQLLKSGDRTQILNLLNHLFLVNSKKLKDEKQENKEEKEKFMKKPEMMTNDIMGSSDSLLTICVGNFIDGMFAVQKEDKEN